MTNEMTTVSFQVHTYTKGEGRGAGRYYRRMGLTCNQAVAVAIERFPGMVISDVIAGWKAEKAGR